MIRTSFLALTLIFFCGFTYPEKPTARVNDYARVLSNESASKLEARLEAVESRTSRQIAVAVFDTIDDLPIEEVATKLFEKWKLGSKKENDGVLLVLAIKDRSVRIEVGYGLESVITDSVAGQIIRNDLTPFLREQNYDLAILAFSKRIESIILNPDSVKSIKKQQARPLTVFLFVLVFFIILFIKALGSQHRSTYTIGSGGIRRRRAIDTFWGGFGGGGGGFGGFGGGGFSGGGGLSGGGGASGKW